MKTDACAYGNHSICAHPGSCFCECHVKATDPHVPTTEEVRAKLVARAERYGVPSKISDVAALMEDLTQHGENAHGNPVDNLRYAEASVVIYMLLEEQAELQSLLATAGADGERKGLYAAHDIALVTQTRGLVEGDTGSQDARSRLIAERIMRRADSMEGKAHDQ